MNPILLDIPDHLLSDRLILRVPRAGDGPMVQAAIEESEAHLKPWMYWMRHGCQTLDETEQYAREAAAAFIRRESLGYRLLRRSDEQFVGMISAFDFAWEVPRCEIGYWARVSMTGQGYITEAVHRLSAFLFDDLGMQRVEIHCDGRNQRSAAVAERAGYTLEARLRHHRRAPDGLLADTLIYAKLREAR